MQTLAKQLREVGSKLKHAKGDYGLEIELETLSPMDYGDDFWLGFNEDNNSHPRLPYWRIINDGSLRNFGKEFVFKNPLSLTEAFEAIDEFHNLLKDVKFIEDAPNASVHVHVDMTKRPIKVMANFITIFLLVENLLAWYCGHKRWSNFFALTCRDSSRHAHELGKFIGHISRGKKPEINSGDVKYSALNIGRFFDLGTLEVRLMRSTSDPMVLKQWLQILDRIVYAAGVYSDPDEVFNKASDDPVAFVRDIFLAEYEVLTGEDKHHGAASDELVKQMVESSFLSVWQFTRQAFSWGDIDTAFTARKSMLIEEFGEEFGKMPGQDAPMLTTPAEPPQFVPPQTIQFSNHHMTAAEIVQSWSESPPQPMHALSINNEDWGQPFHVTNGNIGDVILDEFADVPEPEGDEDDDED